MEKKKRDGQRIWMRHCPCGHLTKVLDYHSGYEPQCVQVLDWHCVHSLNTRNKKLACKHRSENISRTNQTIFLCKWHPWQNLHVMNLTSFTNGSMTTRHRQPQATEPHTPQQLVVLLATIENHWLARLQTLRKPKNEKSFSQPKSRELKRKKNRIKKKDYEIVPDFCKLTAFVVGSFLLDAVWVFFSPAMRETPRLSGRYAEK